MNYNNEITMQRIYCKTGKYFTVPDKILNKYPTLNKTRYLRYNEDISEKLVYNLFDTNFVFPESIPKNEFIEIIKQNNYFNNSEIISKSVLNHYDSKTDQRYIKVGNHLSKLIYDFMTKDNKQEAIFWHRGYTIFCNEKYSTYFDLISKNFYNLEIENIAKDSYIYKNVLKYDDFCYHYGNVYNIKQDIYIFEGYRDSDIEVDWAYKIKLKTFSCA